MEGVKLEFVHKSVLLNEAVESLHINPKGIYVDGTAGGGGHSAEILKNLDKDGKLILIDRDPDAIANLKEKFSSDDRVIIVNEVFFEIKKIIEDLNIESVDGVLLDLGVSSYQLDTAERGFSYHSDAPLDMRMSKSGVSAQDLVNTLSAKQLADIFYKYGEEKFSYQIARSIEKYRMVKPIETTLELAEIIANSYPQKARRDGHPARKCFQALRIAVNGELDRLEEGITGAYEKLNPKGRLSVITFHSLEDRIIKTTMMNWCKGCICPKDFPICVCGKKPKAFLPYKRPIEPTPEEIKENKRSRSARLRVLEKL